MTSCRLANTWGYTALHKHACQPTTLISVLLYPYRFDDYVMDPLLYLDLQGPLTSTSLTVQGGNPTCHATTTAAWAQDPPTPPPSCGPSPLQQPSWHPVHWACAQISPWREACVQSVGPASWTVIAVTDSCVAKFSTAPPVQHAALYSMTQMSKFDNYLFQNSLLWSEHTPPTCDASCCIQKKKIPANSENDSHIGSKTPSFRQCLMGMVYLNVLGIFQYRGRSDSHIGCFVRILHFPNVLWVWFMFWGIFQYQEKSASSRNQETKMLKCRLAFWNKAGVFVSNSLTVIIHHYMLFKNVLIMLWVLQETTT